MGSISQPATGLNTAQSYSHPRSKKKNKQTNIFHCISEDCEKEKIRY